MVGGRHHTARVAPGVVHVHAVLLAVWPLEGVVDVVHGVGSRVESCQHLPVGERVADARPADSGPHLEVVPIVVQQAEGEHVHPAVPKALLVVAARHLRVAFAVVQDEGQIVVRPVKVDDALGEHRELP